MESSSRRSRRILFVVLAMGLLIRIVFILFHQRAPISDELEYHQLALSISDSGSYAINGTPTAYRPAGYPVFLAMSYSTIGHRPFFAKLLQALLDIITAYLLFLVGRTRSERIGLISAMIWSFFAPAILYNNLLFSESLIAFLLVLSLLFLLKIHATAPLPYVSIFGILLGLALLVKPALLLFPLLLLVLFAKMSIPRRHAILSFAFTIAVILPWMGRNFIVLDTFRLSTNSGMNLYVGNNSQASGAYRGAFPAELSDPTLNEVERDQKAMTLAVEYIAGRPDVFVFNGLKKLLHVFRSEGDVLIGSFSEDPNAGFKERYRSVPIFLVAATNTSAFLLLLAGIAGFLISERDRIFWFFAAFLIASLAVHFVFFGGSRFHFPFMPFAVLFASNAIVLFTENRFTMTPKQKFILFGFSATLIGIWAYEFYLIYHTS